MFYEHDIIFSIIIPLYNKEPYIANTLNSVISQIDVKQELYEVIIVNDGSLDQSKEEVLNFIDSELGNKVSIHLFEIENAGVSNARNIGISKAKGEFVCFLDADDMWHERYLSTLLKQISMDTHLNILATNYEITDAPILNNVIHPTFNKKNYIVDKLNINSSSICVRRSIFEDEFFLFDISQSHGEDTDVWFRLSLYFDTLYTDSKLSFYNNCVVGSAVNSLQKLNSSAILEKNFLSKNNRNIHCRELLISRIEEIRVKYVISCLKRLKLKLLLTNLLNINDYRYFISEFARKINKVL
ncbi:glycosyltransferase family 2 protein [Vibrio breoganii]